MARHVTLFTGQWADLPLGELAPKARGFGFDGLELACWGAHLDVDRAANDQAYCDARTALLAAHDLGCWAISHHLAGQLVCDLNDARSDAFAPAATHGNPDAKREWAVETMKNTARAARNLGVPVVCGFTGSSIWHLLYSFPPVTPEMIDAGYRQFAELWHPILDVFDEGGVRFALEVHPTEIAFDIVSAHRALEALDRREAFGFNFDPSHLEWQGIDPVEFIHEFPDRIYHVHLKDAAARVTRLPAGHPEGFVEAFANIYRNVCDTIRTRIQGVEPDPLAHDFPSVDDGLRSMLFIDTVVKSARGSRKWTRVPRA